MKQSEAPHPGWTDERLVRRCLGGDEAAWGALVDKYKNMVYALILRADVPTDDAADVFQAIWLDAYNDLPKLRSRDAVGPWLGTLVRHKCYHWRNRHRRTRAHEVEEPEESGLEEIAAAEPEIDEELARDQAVREAIFSLSERCRELVRLLFFSAPVLPYKEVAEKLGLAVGSIGFIRARCLDRLRKALEGLGFS